MKSKEGSMEKVVISERRSDVLSESDEQTLRDIRRYVAKPPKTSVVISFHPSVAFAVLQEYNRKNRPAKPGKIGGYKKDMAAGEWALTGDTIKFSDANLLRDGQNRLSACYQSRSTFSTHVVFGIPDDFFDRMDRGKNRDGSDLLAIAGYKNTAWLSGAVRWTHLIQNGRVKQRDTLEPRQTLRLLEDSYPRLVDWIQPARRIYENAAQPPGLVMAMLYAFAEKDADASANFAAAWAAAQWGGRFKPIGTMQSALASFKEAGGRVHDVMRAAYIVIAWNLYISKRRGRRTDFAWSLADDFPIIEG